ncbi:MAG: mechanosensitive ion channel family protein, partial [Acidobacteria bacterium]
MMTYRWRPLILKLVAASIAAGLLAAPALAQQTPATQTGAATPTLDKIFELAAAQAVRDAPPAPLIYNNRSITEFRASVVGRPPEDRAAGAREALDRLVREQAQGPVTTRTGPNFVIFSVGRRDLFALLTADVDELAGEMLEEQARQAARQLQITLDETVELRSARRLLWSTLQALVATALALGIMWGLWRTRRSLGDRISRAAQRRIEKTVGDRELVQSSHVLDLPRYLLSGALLGLGLMVTYVWLTFVLRRFPYSRPWGESQREFLLERLAWIGRGVTAAAPGLFTVLLIYGLTRFVARLTNLLFEAAEQGRISLPWVYPETAESTRKLTLVILWLFALAVAYPYLPGSGSEAFRGISVFVGLMVSLGSSGLVNHIMSGFTLTYSRALRAGDFVKVGDVEGTVTHLGTLATKLKTPRGEDVTIPNALMLAQTVINYSRFSDTEGVYVAVSISIGYDTPWRQVEALLLQAAARTPGVRSSPPPVVRQAELGDFSVKYTLLVALERPHQRALVLNAIHANIQDAFNEHGVQIMSPAYEADPS